MVVLAFRMMGRYARLLNLVAKHFETRYVDDENPEQVGALARLFAADLLIIGYEPKSKITDESISLLRRYEPDVLLRAIPVALAFTRDQETVVIPRLKSESHWSRRIMPVAEPDFLSPPMPRFLRAHARRHSGRVSYARGADLPGDTPSFDEITLDRDEGFGFPWACP